MDLERGMEQREKATQLVPISLPSLRRCLASSPVRSKSRRCRSSLHLEFDDGRLVKEALLTSDDEEIWELVMSDYQGEMR